VSLRLTVGLGCDARRARGCHGASAPRGEALPAVSFEARAEAERAGWGGRETTATRRAATCAPPAGPGYNRAATRRPPPRDAGPGASGVLPSIVCQAPDCGRQAVLVCDRCRRVFCAHHVRLPAPPEDGAGFWCVFAPCPPAPAVDAAGPPAERGPAAG
jgi:hypothetical protein